MLRTRFSFACSVAALTISAIPAHAQSAPAPAQAPMLMPARINDIQVARDGDTISILVKLSQQPTAATVKSAGEAMTVEIDGLNLNTLNLSPPAGSLVTRVEAGSGKLTLSGAAFSKPTTVIYRNAVLIEAKLAEPSLQAATSLMGATVLPPKPATQVAAVAPQPVAKPAPVPVKAVQPVTPPVAPAPAPAQPVALQVQPAPVQPALAPATPAPAPAQPALPQPAAPQLQPTPVQPEPQAAPAPAPIVPPEHPATGTPIAPAPVVLAPSEPAPHPKHEAEDQLQSHAAPAQPAPAPAEPASAHTAPIPARPAPAPAPNPAALPTASMAGIDAARCAIAADELAKDAWALAAMGDHALCLIDAGKLDEAKNRIDQLAAITPQDWRVSLGRATLAEKSGDTETAQAAFVSASLAAPNDAIRTAITERVSATPDDKETDLEIPLPTAPAAPAAKAAH